jgi:hypothetical protein
VHPVGRLPEEVAGGPGTVQIWPHAARPNPEIPPAEVEKLEQLDWLLSETDQGDLINRTILFLRFSKRRGTKRYQVKEMLADWRRLAECPDAELRALQGLAAEEVRRAPWLGAVPLNAGSTIRFSPGTKRPAAANSR